MIHDMVRVSRRVSILYKPEELMFEEHYKNLLKMAEEILQPGKSIEEVKSLYQQGMASADICMRQIEELKNDIRSRSDQ